MSFKKKLLSTFVAVAFVATSPLALAIDVTLTNPATGVTKTYKGVPDADWATIKNKPVAEQMSALDAGVAKAAAGGFAVGTAGYIGALVAAIAVAAAGNNNGSPSTSTSTATSTN